MHVSVFGVSDVFHLSCKWDARGTRSLAFFLQPLRSRPFRDLHVRNVVALSRNLTGPVSSTTSGGGLVRAASVTPLFEAALLPPGSGPRCFRDLLVRGRSSTSGGGLVHAASVTSWFEAALLPPGLALSALLLRPPGSRPLFYLRVGLVRAAFATSWFEAALLPPGLALSALLFATLARAHS
jgi:hypothetical protein